MISKHLAGLPLADYQQLAIVVMGEQANLDLRPFWVQGARIGSNPYPFTSAPSMLPIARFKLPLALSVFPSAL